MTNARHYNDWVQKLSHQQSVECLSFHLDQFMPGSGLGTQTATLADIPWICNSVFIRFNIFNSDQSKLREWLYYNHKLLDLIGSQRRNITFHCCFPNCLPSGCGFQHQANCTRETPWRVRKNGAFSPTCCWYSFWNWQPKMFTWSPHHEAPHCDWTQRDSANQSFPVRYRHGGSVSRLWHGIYKNLNQNARRFVFGTAPRWHKTGFSRSTRSALSHAPCVDTAKSRQSACSSAVDLEQSISTDHPPGHNKPSTGNISWRHFNRNGISWMLSFTSNLFKMNRANLFCKAPQSSLATKSSWTSSMSSMLTASSMCRPMSS